MLTKDNTEFMYYQWDRPHGSPDQKIDARRESFSRIALQFIRVRGKDLRLFTAEDLAIQLEIFGVRCLDKRWWGAVMQSAKREGLIKKQHACSSRLTRAGHRTPMWMYVPPRSRK